MDTYDNMLKKFCKSFEFLKFCEVPILKNKNLLVGFLVFIITFCIFNIEISEFCISIFTY